MMLRGLWKLTWIEIKIFLREPLGAFGTIGFPVLFFLVVGRAANRRPPSSSLASSSFIRVDLPVLASLLISISAVLSLVTIISIYREGGAVKGYRVAFDLARAYDKTGDPIRAKEKYRAFLAVVDARRAAGLAIEAIVVQEESEARDWIAKSADTTDAAPLGNGVASEPARPGPSASPSPSPVPSPLPFPSLSPSVSPPPAPAKAQPPFSPAFLISSGAATVAAIVVCGIEYANALSAENGFNAAANQPASVQQGYQTSYDNARPLAYASLGASVGFAAITAGLAVWYFTGTKWVVPVVGAGPGGAEAGLVGRF